MFRRSVLSMISLDEGNAALKLMKGSTITPKHLSVLGQIITGLPKETAVVIAALEHVAEADQEPTDSYEVAMCTRNGRGLVHAMKSQSGEVWAKELCCRALANISMLPKELVQEETPAVCTGKGEIEHPSETVSDNNNSSVANSNSNNSEVNSEVAPLTFADIAVDEGAVEQVLSTLTSISRLSDKGSCWAATALQNLLLFSNSGARIAVRMSGEDIIAKFILEMCEVSDSLVRQYKHSLICHGNEAVIQREELERRLYLKYIAVDAAMACLARLLFTPVEENAAGTEVWAQRVGATSIEAAARAISLPFMLPRAHRCILASNNNSSSSPAAPCDELIGLEGGCAVMVRSLQIGLSHKCWEVMRIVSDHRGNLPLLYDALGQGADSEDSEYTNGVDTLRSGDRSNRGGHAFQQAVVDFTQYAAPIALEYNYIKFLSPSAAEEIEERAQNEKKKRMENGGVLSVLDICSDIHTTVKAFEAALHTLCVLTAPVKGPHNSSPPQDDATVHNNNNTSYSQADRYHESGNNTSGVHHPSRLSIPTESAAVVVNCVASGPVSEMSIRQLRKRWDAVVDYIMGNTSSQATKYNNNNNNNNIDVAAPELSKHSELIVADHAHIICSLLTLMANTADIDGVTSGRNGVAVLVQMLDNYAAIISKVGFSLAMDADSTEGSHDTVMSSANAIQQYLVPCIVKVFATLWNVVGTKEGALAITDLCGEECVRAANRGTDALMSAIVKRNNNNNNKGDVSGEGRAGGCPGEGSVTIVCDYQRLEALVKLGKDLERKFSALISDPVYVQTKHVKKNSEISN